jgi:thioredoxin
MVILMMSVAILTSAQAQDKMRIAVMDFKAGVGVGRDDVDGLSAIFGTYFNDPTKYVLVERTQIDRVISEQGFQYSSLTNQQMVRIGQILNISRMVVGDVNIISGQYNIDVRVVNAETGAVEFTDGETWVKGSSYRELMRKLAGRLLAKMNYTVATPSSNIKTPPKLDDVVTLLGYLYVYPEDIGKWTYEGAIKMCAKVNQGNAHGYNDWRLPTIDELQVIYTYKNKIKGLQDGIYLSNKLWDYRRCKDCREIFNMREGNQHAYTDHPRYTTNYEADDAAFIRLVRTNRETSSSSSGWIPYGTDVTEAYFLAKIYNYNYSTTWEYLGDKPCIIHFYAPWAGTCRNVASILEELAKEYKGKIYIYNVNTEKERAIATKLGINSLPTIIFSPIGGTPKVVTGLLPKETLKRTIEEVFSFGY